MQKQSQSTAIKKIVINGISSIEPYRQHQDNLSALFTAISLLDALKDCEIALVVLLNELQENNKTSAPITLTTPILQRLRNLGVDEKTLMNKCQGFHSLGNWYQGWQSAEHNFVHVEGDYGAGLEKIDFHHWFANVVNQTSTSSKAASYDAFSLAALMAKSGKFIHPVYDNASILSTYQYQLNVDQFDLIAQLTVIAVENGVTVISGNEADFYRSAPQSLVSHVEVDNQIIEGDFFIECVPELNSTNARENATSNEKQWLTNVLPESKYITVEIKPDDKLKNITANQIITTNFGWLKILNLRERQFLQCTYDNSSNVSTIIDELEESFQIKDVELMLMNKDQAQYVNNQFMANAWQGNCLFVGAAASQLESLVENELTLIHQDLTRWLALFPSKKLSHTLISFYNQSRVQNIQCIVDFIQTHYQLCQWRKEPYWSARANNFNDKNTLNSALLLFKNTGIFPAIENQYYAEKYWVSLLVGFGVIPELVTPLVEQKSIEQQGQALKRLAEQIFEFSDKIPNYQHYLSSHGL